MLLIGELFISAPLRLYEVKEFFCDTLGARARECVHGPEIVQFLGDNKG